MLTFEFHFNRPAEITCKNINLYKQEQKLTIANWKRFLEKT